MKAMLRVRIGRVAFEDQTGHWDIEIISDDTADAALIPLPEGRTGELRRCTNALREQHAVFPVPGAFFARDVTAQQAVLLQALRIIVQHRR
jgi:hypothetical protein